MFGYAGKILRVNLTKEKTTAEQLNEQVARKFIGGRGLGAKILFDELKPHVDSLGPENKLVIATGVVTGIPFPGNSVHSVLSKSPLTGIWGEAHAKGFFATELKRAGFDGIIVEGRASKPVYLWVNNADAEIRDAKSVWGKLTRESQNVIKKEIKDESAQIGVIGPAGEKLVRTANILFGFNHVAGRTGLGAVMGSKNLKAIAVRGALRVRYANEEKLVNILSEKLADKEALKGPYSPDGLYKFGSLADLSYWQATGRLPTMNFRRCIFPEAEAVSGETLAESGYVKRHITCPHCYLACNRAVETKYPYKVDPEYAAPEYESLAALSSLCMVNNLPAALKAIELCNKYGMDTISTGVTIAFAMECFEKHLLTLEETEGLDLTWGNHASLVTLTEKIGKREGIGNLLAEGVKRASEKIGRGSEEFSMHIKGLELPMHEIRGMKGHGLAYATSNRGACHLQVETDDLFEGNLCPEIGIDEASFPKPHRDKLYDGPEKVRLNKIVGDLFAVFDSLVVCKWTVYPCGGTKMTTLTQIINAATGWNISIDELMKTGERIINLCRAFNVREGITRKDDTLPKRFTEPLPEGPYVGQTFSKESLSRMLDYYYEFRGWNKETGIPSPEKLEELDLGYVAAQLEVSGPS
jgi:aldehyde:ferredoxin oxidoreductase